jgi:hypothetical protein
MNPPGVREGHGPMAPAGHSTIHQNKTGRWVLLVGDWSPDRLRGSGPRNSRYLDIEGPSLCEGEGNGRTNLSAAPPTYVFGSELSGASMEHGSKPPVLLGDLV